MLLTYDMLISKGMPIDMQGYCRVVMFDGAISYQDLLNKCAVGGNVRLANWLLDHVGSVKKDYNLADVVPERQEHIFCAGTLTIHDSLEMSGQIRTGGSLISDKPIVAGRLETGGDLIATNIASKTAIIVYGKIRSQRDCVATGPINAKLSIKVGGGIKTHAALRAGRSIVAKTIDCTKEIFAGSLLSDRKDCITAQSLRGEIAIGSWLKPNTVGANFKTINYLGLDVPVPVETRYIAAQSTGKVYAYSNRPSLVDTSLKPIWGGGWVGILPVTFEGDYKTSLVALADETKSITYLGNTLVVPVWATYIAYATRNRIIVFKEKPEYRNAAWLAKGSRYEYLEGKYQRFAGIKESLQEIL